MMKEFTASLIPLSSQDKLTLSNALNNRKVIVTAKKMGVQTGLTYLMQVNGNLLYVFSMKDSTKDNVVLTLGCVYPMTANAFDILYDGYLGTQSIIFEADKNIVDKTPKRVCTDLIGHIYQDLTPDYEATIKNEFKKNPKTILYLEAPPENA